MAVGSDENLQNKLSDLVDRPNASNFSWNYAIFWQISRVLGSGIYNLCSKYHSLIHFFKLTFRFINSGMMILQFPKYDLSNFESVNFAIFFKSSTICSVGLMRSFLVKYIGIQTIVLVPTDIGVVKLGSAKFVGD
ncbi:hypothetical protein L484_016695 [Morus notabilis]|uniref:Transcription factor n=1 Tax=Morus notabilis TaxID=981085 RepID=W9REU8_9ROSA|nr:hypothetical protein L484_016695 [Morus notabilis]